MKLKQISLTLPENLYKASKEYFYEFGYRNLQEFIVDMLRRKVILKNFDRYKEIEERMKKNKGVRKFDQKKALVFIKNL